MAERSFKPTVELYRAIDNLQLTAEKVIGSGKDYNVGHALRRQAIEGEKFLDSNLPQRMQTFYNNNTGRILFDRQSIGQATGRSIIGTTGIDVTRYLMAEGVPVRRGQGKVTFNKIIHRNVSLRLGQINERYPRARHNRLAPEVPDNSDVAMPVYHKHERVRPVAEDTIQRLAISNFFRNPAYLKKLLNHGVNISEDKLQFLETMGIVARTELGDIPVSLIDQFFALKKTLLEFVDNPISFGEQGDDSGVGMFLAHTFAGFNLEKMEALLEDLH